jgi:hypothetical protein
LIITKLKFDFSISYPVTLFIIGSVAKILESICKYMVNE